VKAATTTTGVNLTWYLLWEVFLGFNLVLAYRAHQAQSSRISIQTLWTYSVWTILIGIDLVVSVLHGHLEVKGSDWVSLGGAVIGTPIICLFYRKNGYLTDPIAKGWTALVFKAVPQLVLAYVVYQDGAAGIAWVTILTGHLTILSRLIQLRLLIQEAGWDRNRRGSALSEVGNELSWLVTTGFWLFKLTHP
jgi:hypothetical protein